ncbi:protein TBATA isoform X7 [Mesocricetus auratus]|uniref:Protein TBATA isoform X7 n=1 Tax=Mesocricetus auratus TaxID=10036 RepID=A0ABM2WBS6_MESAU|nr:protein TBATA isoform X7 [Mesocricetus auratus]
MTMEVKTQLAEHPLASPKAEPESEKKPAHFPRSLGDAGFQKGPVVPGIVDFDLIQEELKAFKPQTPSAYRFGRLSHHSFFSRHHPQPHHVTHIQDLIGKPVCMVRDEFSLAPLTKSALLSGCLMGIPTISVPVGDPQSIRNPQLSSEAWKKNLKDLASRVANFAKETEARANEAGPAAEQRSEPGKKAFLKEEPPQREQGAKYSAETGRLIPASSYALSRRSRQGQRGHPSGSDGGAQASIPQDQDLLILELLCQILQTDSLNAIQFWLLYAPPKEKDLALGLLQTAVARLMPQPLPSLPAEKLLNQVQELQEPPQETQQATYSPSLKKTKTPPLSKTDKPESMGKAQVLRVHPSKDSEEKTTKSKAEN